MSRDTLTIISGIHTPVSVSVETIYAPAVADLFAALGYTVIRGQRGPIGNYVR